MIGAARVCSSNEQIPRSVMFARAERQEIPGRSIHPAVACDEPTSIFAALLDGLTNQERYTIKMRNGELYIEPTLQRRAA